MTTLIEKELAEREPLFTRPVEMIRERLMACGFERDGKLSISRPISKDVWYAFESKDNRHQLMVQDYKDQLMDARSKLSIKQLGQLKAAVKSGIISDLEAQGRTLKLAQINRTK